MHHDGVEDPLSLYERLAEPLFALALIALALAGRRFAWSLRAALAAGASCAAALVIAQIVARAVDRPRPFVAHPAAVHLFVAHARDPGFPSDHATAAFAIGVTIALYRRGPGLAVLAAALVLAVGRVALGVHYPSDVLAGAILGSAVAVGL